MPAQEEKKAANQDRLKADGTRREPVRRALNWLIEATESKERDKVQGGTPEAHHYIATLLAAWLLETNSIGSSWGVDSWPTLYVLDANGVIRYHYISGRALDRAVDELIKDLDASKSKTSN